MDIISKITNWFGLIYVGIPILSFVVIAIYLLSGGKITKESLDKIVEFSKWYIVSVAIVFAAKTIETSFTERETGIKEMQVYDKYVHTILEADNIEARWKLAEYFSSVTPTDRLRERWVAYKDLIKEDYEKFKALDSTENRLLSKDSLTINQQQELNIIQKEKATFERSLVAKVTGRWVIVFTGDSDLDQSKFEQDKLAKVGIENTQIYLRANSYRVISKIFPDKIEASVYLDSFRDKVRKDVYIVDLDRWCPKESYNGEFYSCQ